MFNQSFGISKRSRLMFQTWIVEPISPIVHEYDVGFNGSKSIDDKFRNCNLVLDFLSNLYVECCGLIFQVIKGKQALLASILIKIEFAGSNMLVIQRIAKFDNFC